MYKIYLSSETISSSQPKIEIEKKKVCASKGETVTFVIFLLTSCFLHAWLFRVTVLSAFP